MQRPFILVAFAALAACASSPEPEPVRDSGQWIESLMQRLDTNNDSVISSAELEDARLAQFARIDRDSSGSINREEASAARDLMQNRREARPEDRTPRQFGERRSPRSGGDMFSRMDSDGNGLISEREFEGRDSRLLDQADFDGDGNLTLTELEDGVSLMRNRRRR